MFDIREYKTALRSEFRAYRQDLINKNELDKKISDRLTGWKAYKKALEIFTYVSTSIEVDTRHLIEQALSDGKRVAVPRCLEGTRLMEFYYINCIDDLQPGTFSVLEPIEGLCKVADVNFKIDKGEVLCIVPGLGFDMSGYRLGYGKGYYDRYLNAVEGLVTVGLCYCGCTRNQIYRGAFDVPVEYLITEKYILKTGPDLLLPQK